jgi:hypothetical protein
MFTPHRPSSIPPPESFVIVPTRSAATLDHDGSERFLFHVPPRWRSPVPRSPYAAEAERRVLGWFESLGCTRAEVDRARRFDIAGYVGIPFPSLPLESTVLLGKYLSLWLLWDDVEVETLGNCWRIEADHILSGQRPAGMTRFDVGWWQLLRDLAERRSPRWIADLCTAMATWSAAAVEEAGAMTAFRERHAFLDFDRQLDLRIATIGMFATVRLLEDAYDAELPPDLHASPAVARLKVLANKIVGLGNDLLSFGKDHTERHINLASTLMHERRVSVDEALARLVRMHDEALQEYDALADTLSAASGEEAPLLMKWLQDVRYASLGFSLWESQAPRYTAHKVFHHGRVVEPRFPFSPGEGAKPPPSTLRAGPSSPRRSGRAGGDPQPPGPAGPPPT